MIFYYNFTIIIVKSGFEVSKDPVAPRISFVLIAMYLIYDLERFVELCETFWYHLEPKSEPYYIYYNFTIILETLTVCANMNFLGKSGLNIF